MSIKRSKAIRMKHFYMLAIAFIITAGKNYPTAFGRVYWLPYSRQKINALMDAAPIPRGAKISYAVTIASKRCLAILIGHGTDKKRLFFFKV